MKQPQRFSFEILIPVATACAVIAFFTIGLPVRGDIGEGGNEISFSQDVLPILRQRCFECHHEDRVEGDLRFDSGRSAVESGGHTGRSILGSSANDSELIRRIRSTQLGYRMPKEGASLSDSEIAIVTQWVDAGARWDAPTDAAKVRSTDGPAVTMSDRLVWFESQMKNPGFSGLVYLSLVFCVTMVGAFFVLRRSQSDSAWLARLKTILIVLLVFLCLATYIHYDAKHKDALSKMKSIQAKLLTYIGPPEFALSLDAPHPMHPPRLGGVYYRGNDERDQRLFNGGFYRTAQLEVWLTNEQGQRLQRGDVASGDLFIDFDIKRAANTTGELFSDHVMSVIGLTDDFLITDSADHRAEIGKLIPMETIEPNQKWRSRYRVGSLNDRKEFTGKFYLVQNTSKPKAHYAVEFEVKVDGASAITRDSQLWMGSLYNLNGRVFVPYDDQKILLDRWFDFRPIPEITGAQTDDPNLLGIPEHL